MSQSQQDDDDPEQPDNQNTQPFHAIVDADTLGATVDSLRVLLDECKIHLNDGGLRVAGVEPANVAMAYLDLDAAAFESYQGADGGVLGMNLARLQDIIGLADSEDLVELEYDPEIRKLLVQFSGLEYTLALIDPDSIRQEPDDLDLDLPTEVTIEGRDFSRALKASDMVSDHIRLRSDADAQQFIVEAEGDTDDVNLEFDTDDVISADLPETVQSLYSLSYLTDMETATGSDDELTLSLGDEFPIEIDFDYADGDGHVQYSLAPRIQSD